MAEESEKPRVMDVNPKTGKPWTPDEVNQEIRPHKRGAVRVVVGKNLFDNPPGKDSKRD